MKSTFSFTKLGLGALLVTLAPACTVSVSDDSDTTDDSAEDAGDTSDQSSDDDTSGTVDGGGTPTDGADAGDDTSGDTDTSDGDSTDGIDITLDTDTSGDAGSETPGDGGVAAEGRNGCGEDSDEATVVGGPISDAVTWSGTVKVEGDVSLRDGSSLTIEPGTHIIMSVDSSIELGWNSGASTLTAEGTATNPIIFCGENEDRGYWQSFIVGRNVTSNSVLRHVRFFDGGGDVDAAVELAASILVDNVVVSNSDSAGVAAVDFDDDSEVLSVSDSKETLILRADGAATRFPQGGSFDGNDETLARLRFTTTTRDLVFADIGIPYLQEADLQVRDGGSVTFEAGVEYRFGTDATLDVGWNSGAAEIQVAGTEEAPVVFRGRSQDPGYWEGVIIGRNVLSSSSLNHLFIHDGGGSEQPVVDVGAEITLNHVTLIDNETGMLVRGDGVDTDSTTLTITGTEGYPLTVEPEAVVTLPKGGDLTGNDTDQVLISGGTYTIEGTVPNLGVPYRIEGEFQTRDGSSLTVEAGTHFVMAPDSSMVFGWNSGTATVAMEGTEEDPIRFSGVVDDAGSWTGLTVGRNVLSSSAFRWVEFAHAGGDDYTLKLDRAVDVENCSFTDYDGVGILKLEEDETDYTVSNTFTGDEVGDQ